MDGMLGGVNPGTDGTDGILGGISGGGLIARSAGLLIAAACPGRRLCRVPPPVLPALYDLAPYLAGVAATVLILPSLFLASCCPRYCLYFLGSFDMGCLVFTPRCDISTAKCALLRPVFLPPLMPRILAFALRDVALLGVMPPGGLLNSPVDGRHFRLLSL